MKQPIHKIEDQTLLGRSVRHDFRRLNVRRDRHGLLPPAIDRALRLAAVFLAWLALAGAVFVLWLVTP